MKLCYGIYKDYKDVGHSDLVFRKPFFSRMSWTDYILYYCNALDFKPCLVEICDLEIEIREKLNSSNICRFIDCVYEKKYGFYDKEYFYIYEFEEHNLESLLKLLENSESLLFFYSEYMKHSSYLYVYSYESEVYYHFSTEDKLQIKKQIKGNT